MKDDSISVEALKKGDPKALSDLYNKYWKKLYYAAYKRLGSQCETEDIIQDLFVDLWKNRERLDIKKSFAAYIFTALKFKIFRFIDAKAVRRKYMVNLNSEEITRDFNVEESVLFNELFELIHENVEKLPKKCRIVFKLSRYKNYTVNEISKKLNISPNTAQNHISKALKQLRLELKNIMLSIIAAVTVFFQ